MLEMDLGYEGTHICVLLSPYILQVAVKHIPILQQCTHKLKRWIPNFDIGKLHTPQTSVFEYGENCN